MMPEPVLFYEAKALRTAWCADAMRHGSVKGVALKVGISWGSVYDLLEGSAGLPKRVLTRLGLLPVRGADGRKVIGYIAFKPIDFAVQWQEEEDASDAAR